MGGHIGPPRRTVHGLCRLRLRLAHDRARVQPHTDLVERHGEILPPADDVRLDLRRGPGFRHRAASVISCRCVQGPGTEPRGEPATTLRAPIRKGQSVSSYLRAPHSTPVSGSRTAPAAVPPPAWLVFGAYGTTREETEATMREHSARSEVSA
ncbi:hypothetical protein GCM10010211_66700 [Streptomyces albospinus]|uniref:Uncharacterized protein n=1 Tax=Streptomyces albospinus TaxID=285515 RepID=A0ABQ2VK19_9ACTN|nr:hypothetical protein GCM10010211_66700 [Streptomyces albospinus]